MPPAVTVRGLTKRYDSVVAIQDVDFEVGVGEIFGLIGPNGAGKTTILECILGLTPSDSGEIAVGGINALAAPSRAKEKLGAQLQTSALPDAMTPRQALKLCAAFYRHPAAPEELIEQFDLVQKAGARYASLSTGQKQRLALALAFVSQPEVVVLDEPTASLDPPARRELHALISAQRAAGRTILFTTHYLEEARSLCDRVGLMSGGRLLAVDSPNNLIARSHVLPRLTVRTRPPIPEGSIRLLPAVMRVTKREESWILETTALNHTLTEFSSLSDALGVELDEIQIHRPTLDDAFEKLVPRP